MNVRNISNIRHQIRNKNGSNPYWSTDNNNRNVITDYDNFPYERWFRGEPHLDVPVVAEREAGWRPRNEDCYNSIFTKKEKQRKHHEITPKHYFQPPCSVVYPKYVSNDELSLNEVKLNENCVLSYR
jgi:hypothetical protein